MKKLLDQLNVAIEGVEAKISYRDDVFNDRSENWQDSEKGRKYEDKTGKLDEVRYDLQTAVDSLETYLGY